MNKTFLMKTDVSATIRIEAASKEEALSRAYNMSAEDLEYSIVDVMPLSCCYREADFEEEHYVPIWEEEE